MTNRWEESQNERHEWQKNKVAIFNEMKWISSKNQGEQVDQRSS